MVIVSTTAGHVRRAIGRLRGASGSAKRLGAFDRSEVISLAPTSQPASPSATVHIRAIAGRSWRRQASEWARGRASFETLSMWSPA